MNIHVTHRICRAIPGLDQVASEMLGDRVYSLNLPYQHNMGWLLTDGYKVRPYKSAATETGFWRHCWHNDTRGLWTDCSLNLPEARKLVAEYKAPKPAKDILREIKGRTCKYDQPGETRSWSGPVLATQVPWDRAITSVNGNVTMENHRDSSYWRFYEDACATFRDHLFVKLHPKMGLGTKKEHVLIAARHGCECGEIGMGIVDDCAFVLTFNSTLAIDAWLRDARVIQYAPGYFSHTGAVTFADGEIADSPGDTRETEQKLLDFIIWRYCWCTKMEVLDCVKMFKAFATAERDDLFPMKEEWSYGANARRIYAEA